MNQTNTLTALVPLSRTSKLTNYSIIPHGLFDMDLSMPAMILYSRLLNRANLSISNGKADEHGRIYIYYRQEELMEELHVCKSSVKAYMKELVKAGLIEKHRANTGRANRIFVKVPASSIMGYSSVPYRAESRPIKGCITDLIRGSRSTPNNYKNNKFN